MPTTQVILPTTYLKSFDWAEYSIDKRASTKMLRGERAWVLVLPTDILRTNIKNNVPSPLVEATKAQLAGKCIYSGVEFRIT